MTPRYIAAWQWTYGFVTNGWKIHYLGVQKCTSASISLCVWSFGSTFETSTTFSLQLLVLRARFMKYRMYNCNRRSCRSQMKVVYKLITRKSVETFCGRFRKKITSLKIWVFLEIFFATLCRNDFRLQTCAIDFLLPTVSKFWSTLLSYFIFYLQFSP